MFELLMSLALAATPSTYEVHAGCPAVDATHTRTVTIDPAKGETLEAFFTAKKINSGDHVILLAGWTRRRQHGG